MLPNVAMVPGLGDFVYDLLEGLGVANPRGKVVELPGNNTVAPIKLGGWELPWEPIVSVRAARKIEAEDVDGLDTSVKHDTGLGDWRVVLHTIVANTMAPLLSFNQRRKLDRDLKNYVKLLKNAGPLSIVMGQPLRNQESILEVLGIDQVVVEGMDIEVIPGTPHEVRLTLSLLSDKDVELIKNE